MASKQILEAYTERERAISAINRLEAVLAGKNAENAELKAQVERVHDEWAQEHARVKMELNGWLRRTSKDRDKFERWFLVAAQERDELIQAAQEARAGHAGRLYQLLDAMKGEG